MESNEGLVLYNFYSRIAKTTGIVSLKEDVKKTFSDGLPSKASILLKINIIQQEL